jgi:hypothetical protein
MDIHPIFADKFGDVGVIHDKNKAFGGGGNSLDL